MLKIKETYIDYNGMERTEEFYFDYNEAEIAEMELSEAGGLVEHIQRICSKLDGKAIIKVFKDLVLNAYGEKSEDGRRFVKNDKLKEEFSQTRAYSQIFMRLALDAEEAANFINNVVPEKHSQETTPKAIPSIDNK